MKKEVEKVRGLDLSASPGHSDSCLSPHVLPIAYSSAAVAEENSIACGSATGGQHHITMILDGAGDVCGHAQARNFAESTRIRSQQ